ncbi:hypothetical protein HDU67_001690, partial [Dinochytrium kinnereticum]
MPPSYASVVSLRRKEATVEGGVEFLPTVIALIVEDDVIGQRILERFLLSTGVTSLPAHDMASCLEAISTSLSHATTTPPTPRIDTIFMDIQLSGRVNAGIEAVKAIRRMEAETLGTGGGRRMRIVGVSGNSNPRLIQEAIEAGMDEFVVKPIRRDDVVRLVRGER